MKYLVTGATGFLGAHVVQSLEAHGHDVVAFSRSTGGDVLDPVRVREAARGCDGVLHCAGRVSRRREDAAELYRVHVEGTRTLLDACAELGVRRVVVASTSGTLGVSLDPRQVATEDTPSPIGILARWPYYRAKLFAERAALGYGADRLQVVCVNPSLLLGPGDVHGSSTEDVRLLLQGSVRAVPAGGLAFVDVRDAADAMRLAMERGRPGERYIVSACNLTVADFCSRVARAAGVRGPWLRLPRSPELARLAAAWAGDLAWRFGLRAPVDPVSAEMAQYYWYVDSSKAQAELGWRARDPGATLYDTIDDLERSGVVLPGTRTRSRVDA